MIPPVPDPTRTWSHQYLITPGYYPIWHPAPTGRVQYYVAAGGQPKSPVILGAKSKKAKKQHLQLESISHIGKVRAGLDPLSTPYPPPLLRPLLFFRRGCLQSTTAPHQHRRVFSSLTCVRLPSKFKQSPARARTYNTPLPLDLTGCTGQRVTKTCFYRNPEVFFRLLSWEKSLSLKNVFMVDVRFELTTNDPWPCRRWHWLKNESVGLLVKG